jgi:hypothetical protein
MARYGEAAKAFNEARQFGRKYGALPQLARATSMSAGFRLSVFDFEGAESTQLEAREIARNAGWHPPEALPDETMRRRFTESEVAHRIRRL